MDEKQKAVIAMVRYGGSFVMALGLALDHANANNTAKIKATFADEWKRYLQMYELAEERDRNE
jgi:hypothetical protein